MLVDADSEKTFLPRRAETLRAMIAPSLHPSALSPRTHTSLTLGGTGASARAKGAIATTASITKRRRPRAKSVLLAISCPVTDPVVVTPKEGDLSRRGPLHLPEDSALVRS